MIKEERLLKIEECINAHRFAGIDTLVEFVGSSKPTVRRDLHELVNQGKIRLVRGGAMSLSSTLGTDKPSTVVPEIPEMDLSDMPVKRRLACTAAKLIEPHDNIFLCAGRTTREMVGFFKNVPNLKVVTNDFSIANELSLCPNINVMVCGGELKTGKGSISFTCGYAAEDFVSKLRIDKVFLSCDSIDINSGCYISNPDEVGLMRGVFKVSSSHIIMAEHQKFSQNAFVSICGMNDIDLLISDAELPSDIRAQLSNYNIECQFV